VSKRPAHRPRLHEDKIELVYRYYCENRSYREISHIMLTVHGVKLSKDTISRMIKRLKNGEYDPF